MSAWPDLKFIELIPVNYLFDVYCLSDKLSVNKHNFQLLRSLQSLLKNEVLITEILGSAKQHYSSPMFMWARHEATAVLAEMHACDTVCAGVLFVKPADNQASRATLLVLTSSKTVPAQTYSTWFMSKSSRSLKPDMA